MASKEYEFFLKANLHQYEGKYVVIVGDQIISSGENGKEVYEEAERKTGKKPMLVKVPTEDQAFFTPWGFFQ